MLVVGIVGGIASGKSLVSKAFAEHGAEIIDADRLGHDVLRDEEVIAAARELWGAPVLNAQGELNRTAIAAIVFGESPRATAERRYLEQLTHPRITARMRDRISQLATEGATDLVVIDAALLLEAGWHEYCDHILFVDVPAAERERRAAARGWSLNEFRAREAAQLSLNEKRQAADTVLDNSGSPEQIAAQVARLWRTWVN